MGCETMSWLKKFLGKNDDDDKNVHSFDEDTKDITDKQYKKLGVQSIETDKIIGSVGRAHELDKNFRYRNRAATQRYHNIDKMLSEGKPSDPIEVLKVKRKRGQSQYYVMDGHHRVAQAKKHGYGEVNANITEVEIPETAEFPEGIDLDDNADE